MSKSTKAFVLGAAVGVVAHYLYTQGAVAGGER